MSKEKHYKKKHHKNATNEKKNEQSKSQLFTEADAKSVEVSGYTLGRGAPQSDQFMPERSIPTGVVDIDESVQLPKSPSEFHDPMSYKVLSPSKNYDTNYVHLPPISQHPYYKNYYYPYGYHHALPDYHHNGYLSPPYPMYHEYQSPHQHQHHHHHHHRKHRKAVETYDPRWWYLPLNSVHAPKTWRPPEYHYTPPKWYESPSKQSRTSMYMREPIPSPRKYVDCRCAVCKPSKETPHGIRWYTND